ncbi:family 20 glycosylhydrolase [Brevundimonas faecalis]|uniref:family 20 glycosylhydrolase n=1 Tax=Brevundimonas faecalis TaxID=947378 RepID=UPI00360A6E71
MKPAVRRAIAPLLTLALASTLSLTAASAQTERQAPALIPRPVASTPSAGVFALTEAAPIVVPRGDAEAARAAAYFADLMRRTRGLNLTVREGDAPVRGAVVFRRSQGGRADAYRLDVTENGATIVAGDFGGLLYGGISLWQLATAEAGQGPATLQAVAVEDYPRFGWRGVMLDSARHYQSPEFIKGFIDWMATHKLNVFHWHLTDDQAWRLEIKRYPRLTEVGGWRVHAGAAAQKDIDPTTGRPRLYGGVYTQDQVRDIVAYAAARNIVVVPEIDVPGHASAAVAAYPELGVTDVPSAAVLAVPADWGVYPTLFNVEESTLFFLENVMDEVVALFPSEYVHIGGDEAVKDQWKASARVQERMRELGLADEEKLQSWLVARLEKRLNDHGRRMIGWDEILEGGINPNASVMSWRGVEGAIEAARLGHDTVMSPAPVLYLDNRQSADDGSPGRGFTSTLRDVYSFDPTPDELTPEQAGRVIGVQANLFTEHMRTEDRVEYQAFPRISALAEMAWTPHEWMDFADFRARLDPQLARYRSLGVDYATIGLSETPAPTPQDGERRYDHQLKLCTAALPLSLIDDAPLEGERPALLMDIFNPCWIYQSADLSRGLNFEAAVGQVPFNFQIGADREKIRLGAPRTPAGELEIRIDGCEGEPALIIPLAEAAGNDGITTLSGRLPARAGRHDLCLKFTQKQLDPMWGVDWVKVSDPAAKREDD